MSGFESLQRQVVDQSAADTGFGARREWRVDNMEVDVDALTKCVCGNHGLKYLYRIVNAVTGYELEPIGSVCITQFENPEMDLEVGELRDLVDLDAAMRRGELNSIHGGGFSRRRIAALYRYGAFDPGPYNRWDGYNDYEFVLDMFNRRNEPTVPQARKLAAVLKDVRWYLSAVRSGTREREVVNERPSET